MIDSVVSIITATFNRAHLIAETLESIQQQTYKNWECLIIDDGSTDDTATVVKTFSNLDSRFKYFRRGNDHLKGLPGCRNDGLNRAQGNYVIFFDDDDIVHPMNLEICVSEFSKANIDFCRYEREVFTGNFNVRFDMDRNYVSERLEESQLEEFVTGRIPLNSCQVMWRRECFEEHKFNEKLMYAEEWECYLRILSDGFKGVTVDKVLFFGRKHPRSNTGEFWANDPVRRESKVGATKMVVDNLAEKKLLTPRLIRYFVQLGIFLKEKSIVQYVLKKAPVSSFEKLKYYILYELYPLIVIGHRTKKILLNK
ncbi:glycosyltransferase family 2 protein [Salinimicrobium sp. CAU 1759]